MYFTYITNMPVMGRGLWRGIRNKISLKGPHPNSNSNWPRTENSKQHNLPMTSNRHFILVKSKFLHKPKVNSKYTNTSNPIRSAF